jgi:hypothetical protein
VHESTYGIAYFATAVIYDRKMFVILVLSINQGWEILGATTLSIMTFRIMTFSITIIKMGTLSITTLSIMTLRIMTFSITINKM